MDRSFRAYGDLVRDFSMLRITVLQDKHAIVAFEIVENDDVSMVAVHVDGKVFKVLKC